MSRCKYIVLVPTMIAVDGDLTASNPASWMVHCHNARHAEAGNDAAGLRHPSGTHQRTRTRRSRATELRLMVNDDWPRPSREPYRPPPG